MRVLLVFCFCTMLLLASSRVSPTAAAQRPRNEKSASPQDQPLQLRSVDARQLTTLRENKDFQYEQDIRPDTSAWERFWRRIGKWLSKWIGGSGESSTGTNTFWKYFAYVFVLGITLFVILKLLEVDFAGLFGRKSAKMSIPYETYSENIHELDFQDLITEAEAQGDYRRAIRLYYLSLLKKLSDADLIAWTPSKTNRTYVTELKSQGLRASFADITSLFEFVWYGGSAVTEGRFTAVRKSFLEFDQTLQQQV